MESKKIILIGYSGHAFVVHSIFASTNKKVWAYCDAALKESNPFSLQYLGAENQENVQFYFLENDFFISIGDNNTRAKVYESLAQKNFYPVNAIHSSAIICPTVNISENGVMICAGVIINPLSKIGKGVICNTGSIIEHDCVVENFAHIAPGAVLCGNVSIGANSFIGAGTVVKQGITIGRNVIVGAGSVVVKNIPDNATVYGNPAKLK